MNKVYKIRCNREMCIIQNSPRREAAAAASPPLRLHLRAASCARTRGTGRPCRARRLKLGNDLAVGVKNSRMALLEDADHVLVAYAK